MHAIAVRTGLLFAVLPAVAHAAVTFESIGECGALSISSDGTVIAGNTNGIYETFRWTTETGIVPLGRSTTDVFGSGAGTPDISDDGTQISATIIDESETAITQGRWTEGTGWEETMPPLPADGGTIDNAYGSAWGLSGDGSTLVGLYWRPGSVATGLAHACYWTEATGVVDLGSTGKDSRANDADEDGNVIVGWNSRFDGVWQPTVWVDGVLEILSDAEGFTSADCVNEAGTIIGGNTWDADANNAPAAVWRWNGTSWDEEILGTLPGTIGTWGFVTVNDMTPDGSRMVGYNRFASPQFATGFIWEAGTGMVDVEDFLEDNGVVIPSHLDISTLTGISDDGNVMCGIAQQLVAPFQIESFIITIDPTLAVGDGSLITPSFVRTAPNPTRGATTFTLTLPSADTGTLDVFDVTGRRVRRLLDGAITGESTIVSWDGRDALGARTAPGVYYTRLATVGGHSETQRLVVVR